MSGPRRDEALATLVDEGCSQELALLIEGPDGPLVIYVMEVSDVDHSVDAAAHSTHPIDADHKRVLGIALGDHVPCEVLLDLRV